MKNNQPAGDSNQNSRGIGNGNNALRGEGNGNHSRKFRIILINNQPGAMSTSTMHRGESNHSRA